MLGMLGEGEGYASIHIRPQGEMKDFLMTSNESHAN